MGCLQSSQEQSIQVFDNIHNNVPQIQDKSYDQSLIKNSLSPQNNMQQNQHQQINRDQLEKSSQKGIEKQQILLKREQYIKWLIITIKDHKYSSSSLIIVLDKIVFDDIQSDFTSGVFYLGKQSQEALIHILQQYIYQHVRFTFKLENDEGYKYSYTYLDSGGIQKNIIYYGTFFGGKIMNLLAQVKMKRRWVSQSLRYFKKFAQYKISFDNGEQLIQIINQIRHLCQKEKSAIFYITILLIQCCFTMLEKCSLVSICQALKTKANILKNMYGVKQKRMKEIQEFKKIKGNLNESLLDMDQNQKTSIQNRKSSTPIKVLIFTDQNKERQLQQEIIRLVQFAKQVRSWFRFLFQGSCTRNRGYNFKVGMKLQSRRNLSSLQRVKEKILGDQIIKLVKPFGQNQRLTKCQSLFQWVKQQKVYVQELLKESLKGLDKVPLNITDILRGKCIFNKVSDIKNTISLVEGYIQSDKKLGMNVQLYQVVNRLNYITQDVMLKVRIQDLICQFQLSLNFDAIDNQIHHKMYEIVRSRMISPICILLDWYDKIALQYHILLDQHFTGHVNMSLLSPESQKQLKQMISIKAELFERWSFPQIELQIEEPSKSRKNIKEILKQKILPERVEYCKKQRMFQTMDYFIALKKYEKIFKMQSQITDESLGLSGEDQIKAYNRFGQIYFQLGQNDNALRNFQKASELQKQLFPAQINYILSNLAAIYNRKGDYNKSIQCFQRLLEERSRSGRKQSLPYIMTLKNLGIIYRNLGKYQEAQGCFIQSLKIYERLFKTPDEENYIQLLHHTGINYTKWERYVEALEYLRRSVAISQKIKGKNSLVSSKIYSSLADLYKSMKNYEQAYSYLLRSFTIKCQTNSLKNEDQLSYLQELMDICELTNRKEQAISYKNKMTAKKLELNNLDKVTDKRQIVMMS